MTPEAPEFHTNTLSPLSPLPVHPPEPSKIPVLRNQIDPVFNMTSTHLDSDPPNPAVVAPTDPNPVSAKPSASPSSDSNFSDAYKEQPEEMQADKKDTEVVQGSDGSDDYAMTFDSDAEEHADSQDVSQAISQPDSKILPVSVSQNTLPFFAPIDSASTTESRTGHATHPIPISPSLTIHAAAASHDSNAAQSLVDTASPNTQTQTQPFDDVTSGGIDIQQLLDNITANAEKKESSSAAATPPANISEPVSKSSSGLPAHSSLPPRPNLPQKRHYEDIQNFHPGAKGLPPLSSSYRPGPLVAAGAPGTSTDPRGGLPPPPSASFHPPSLPAASPISPASFGQMNRPSMQGHQARSSGSHDEVDAELDAKWGPDIQKIYDEFLENERMYVTEGLWDRFPNGSRLFIGKRRISF
jgi:nuclear polyadenylated RNA-binding protein 3